jgi:hypothetical protein
LEEDVWVMCPDAQICSVAKDISDLGLSSYLLNPRSDISSAKDPSIANIFDLGNPWFPWIRQKNTTRKFMDSMGSLSAETLFRRVTNGCIT